MAKTDVDNLGAGRAAKGASPVASTTKKALKLKGFEAFFFYLLSAFYHLGQQIGQQTKNFLHLLSEKEQNMATIYPNRKDGKLYLSSSRHTLVGIVKGVFNEK